MNLTLKPAMLDGKINLPPSKSLLHRALICAYLADYNLDITGYEISKDIATTKYTLDCFADGYSLDCGESGSTLRFLLPIACALGLNVTFTGEGRLPERPLIPYLREFIHNGIQFSSDKLPITISGKLKAGKYNLEGNISSQFISGLLFALPLLDGDSEIIITTSHESKPYTDMTLACIRNCGINIIEKDNTYIIKGNQKYIYSDIEIEADYSQAAFFLVANFLGSNIKIDNLPQKSIQGDQKIVEILENLKNNTIDEIDCKDTPDLVPVLAVACCFAKTRVILKNTDRLRLKESDRLTAISTSLNKIGGKLNVTKSGLIIEPIDHFTGGITDSVNDHRIAMSLAIAAQKCNAPITIINAECVGKSYPSFWDEYHKLRV
ncbi:3-phosphoshikimate 1-carboxyvinyltransferase [Clostridia bacterium]|nr:3-phosphoshikimate 1-carboxyvinyltransferase [Clostridia bacterium]